MTEKTKIMEEYPIWPPAGVFAFDPHPVDPVAFVVALIGAPILVGLIGFWAVVPIFAIGFGAPTYLTFGALFLFLALHSGADTLDRLAFWASIANLASAPAIWAAMHIGWGESADDAWFATQFTVGWGLIFAPLWGLVFGWLYRLFRRDFYDPDKEGEF